jgi:endoglucanase
MKRRFIVAAVVSLVVIIGGCAGTEMSKEPIQPNTDIRLNSLGYLPAAQKKATIISKCSNFTVKEASNGKAVYSGKVIGPFSQADVNQTAWIADFSKVNKPGKYYLEVPDVGRSIDFEIGDKVYDFAFYTSMRAFYLARCGTEVNAIFNGHRFYHAACHTDDAWQDYISDLDSQYLNSLPPGSLDSQYLNSLLPGSLDSTSRDPNAHGPNSRRDATGGWHDAGDYNKYVVNAGVTMGAMFLAWEQFGDKLKNIKLDIPDTAPGYPDYLKELKWETDWLLKMQYPDGSGRVSHKISTLRFGGFILPEKETEKRYFVGWGSPATADFTAMMAMAARYFKPYDEKYAQTCLEAAKKSYEFLDKNREDKQPDQSAFRTGVYPTTDQDDRMWAAVELWETTGEPNYLRAFERACFGFEDKIEFYWDWGNVKNLAMFTYLFSEREGRRDTLVADIRRDLIRTADSIVNERNKDIYGRCLGEQYRWGSNGTVARECLTLQLANRVSPNPEYIDTALDSINHLFGRNYYCRSFVTGLGYKPPMNPHDRRSGGDKVRDPWPGYIVGGGHSATGWQDMEKDARTNEICINWQGALVYALAGFTSGN